MDYSGLMEHIMQVVEVAHHIQMERVYQAVVLAV
jgi:hypothetical protein